MPSPSVAGTHYTFPQLEDLWIQAGGNVLLAPTMAAIGLAESSGNPQSINPNDNNGRQSSWGIWQISNGTHAAPDPNWADPLTNAKLAVQKYNSQGLGAWGTYTSGAYKKYMMNGTTTPANANTSGSSDSSGNGPVKHYWQINGPAGIHINMDPLLWSGLIAMGALSILAGGAFLIVGVGMESKTAKQIVSTTAKISGVMK